MTALDERQRQLLASLPRSQRRARWLGSALIVLGLSYLGFAYLSFDPRRPADVAGYDAALTEPILAHYAASERVLRRLEPQTFTELQLSIWLRAQARTSGALLVLAYRGLLGVLATLLGFAVLTVTIERARLLRIVAAQLGGEARVGDPE